MSDEQPIAAQVPGERDAAIGRVPAQSRVSNVLAIALMSLLGLGSLTWYYANALLRTGRAKDSAQAAAAQRAQGDTPLPSLGRVDPPLNAWAAPEPAAEPPDDKPLAARTLTEMPIAESSVPPVNGAPPPKSPAEVALEREMSGPVFGSSGVASTSTAAAASGDALPVKAPGYGSTAYGAPENAVYGNAASGDAARGDGSPRMNELATLLRARVTPAARAQMLPARRLLLPKGAFIDCTLETAIDSTLPGMTTCVTATDTFGVDGKVVLLERGTKLIGETRGQVQQGAARIFVLWTEARSPTDVVVPLDSPGADELGRSGLPGEVERHFWQRFGAAMLVSVIDGAVQAAAQSSRGGGATVVVNPSASQDVLTEILKNTVNIPPTVVKPNGDRIQVLVARDVDFRSVYELRSGTGR
jgi:type IV secretion system protein VirB10